MSPVAYIGFGSNLGDRRGVFEKALSAVDETPGMEVTGAAKLYETDPVGLTDGGGEFLNSVIRVETDLSAPEVMAVIGSIERRLGKPASHESDKSRIVDLDLLLYGDSRISVNGLEVPHPRMHERAFVLVPLSDLAPDALHPVFGRTAAELKNRLPDMDLAGVRVFRDGGEPDGKTAGTRSRSQE